MSIWSDIIDAIGIAGGNGSDAAALGTASSGAVSDVGAIAGIGEALTAFFNDLTNVTMWRSLGWLALGVVLMFIGIALIAKDKGVLPDFVPIPV